MLSQCPSYRLPPKETQWVTQADFRAGSFRARNVPPLEPREWTYVDMDRFEMPFCRSRRVRQGANWIEAGGRVWFAEELPLGAPKPAALNVAAFRALMSTAVSPTQLRVIRSVNCLHSLGKKQAISLLLEVASPPDMGPIIATPDDTTEPDPSPHDQRVCMIIPLLFDVPDNGTPPPDAWYCADHRKWTGVAGTQVLQGDIPFAITGEWTYGGKPDTNTSFGRMGCQTWRAASQESCSSRRSAGGGRCIARANQYRHRNRIRTVLGSR